MKKQSYCSALFTLLAVSVLLPGSVFAQNLQEHPDRQQTRVMMVSDDSTELYKLKEALKKDSAVNLKTRTLQNRNVSSLLKVLDKVQKYNNEHSEQKQAQILFLPVAISLKTVNGGKTDKSRISTLKNSIQTLHNNGTLVVAPAGDQSRRISNSSGQVVPASFKKTLTFSSLEYYEPKDKDENKDKGLIGGIIDGIKDSLNTKKLRLSKYSNYGKEVNFGVKLTERRLQLDNMKLDNSTLTAALFGVKEAAQYQAKVFARTEMYQTPDHVQKAMKRQSKSKHQSMWDKDPDDFQEPLLNLDMTYYKEDVREDDYHKPGIPGPGTPGNGGVQNTVEVQVHPYFEPTSAWVQDVKYQRYGETTWHHLHRWTSGGTGLGAGMPQTFEINCGSSSAIRLRTEVQNQPGQGPRIEPKIEQTTVNCGREFPFNWMPF